MSQVDFHTGLADKLPYACRLLRKAYRAGRRVVVTGDAQQLARLDQLLWTFDPGEFIPHARLRAGEQPAARLAPTPLWLADRPADAGPADVLVNLGPAALDAVPLPARTIELVARGDDDVAAGRLRWRQHVAAGRTPTNHPQADG
ncbi:MAG: DNA polymerase III subunit chi [Pseudomonadota bacterium]